MSGSATSVRDGFQAFLLRMAEKFQPFPDLRRQSGELQHLADSLSKPFTLAVFGRMNTGKSSLINALMGKPLTITGGEEVTATLNYICYGDTSQEETILVNWKDGRVESIPFSRLVEWSGKEQDVLDRVRDTEYLQLYANATYLKGIQIVDTPGTGSVAEEHEHAAREVLSPRAWEDSEEEGRKADALLYVFSPVGREGDESSLTEFQKTRPPSSDPYNSIGVLHKWDHLDTTAAASKAERLKNSLYDVVCDVIPVSAPLAMVARHAPDSFLEGLLEITSSSGMVDSLKTYLKRDSRWDCDEGRRRARMAYPLPWDSFARLINLLVETSCASVTEARATSLDASGLLSLEDALDQRFFRRAAVIKQRLTRVKAKGPVEVGLMVLNRRIQEVANDHRHFRDLASGAASGDQHTGWLMEKTASTKQELTELEDYAIEADSFWLLEEDRMCLMERDLAFLEKMAKTPGFVEARDRESVERLMDSVAESGNSEPLPKEVLNAMILRYQQNLNAPVRRTREHFEHLIWRLHERLQTN